ncbi:hypothetical protein AAE02nite_43640 [Adhaeribacter aerolatus]|uniref:Ig-like domain-containing protein n=1 Tax=Adhaeribacter aerolatus TaxID=670289 RepID=A0A512B420_9BACT|nr:gliding motility-associated C-terminal domain-containing protein [Adhaeribacter aerolatus]GEO06700.1 hypothetical protein AAE02nite_43640 [Adhaeribacter aerolatus]
MIIFTHLNKKTYLKINLYLSSLITLLLWPILTQAQFVTKGDAVKISDRCYKITEDKLNRYGTIWWNEKIDLSRPVELSFILYMGTKDQYGADGIAFLFHDDPRGYEATGAVAGGLGYGYSVQDPNANVIKPSVAIEFDTYDNGSAYGDFHDDHTTVVYNGKVGQPEYTAIPINPNSRNIEDNTCHVYKISWDPATQELKLYFDDQLRFTKKDDIINNVFNGQTLVYYGFSGSTGGMSNEQTICLLDPDSKPDAQNDLVAAERDKPIIIPVTANDGHTRGEPITLSNIAGMPQNGIVTLDGQTIIYTPNPGFIGTDTFTYEVCEAGSTKCYSRCATATVTVNVACPANLLPQSATISTSGPTTICDKGSLTLSVPEQPGVTYQWKKDGQNTGSNTPSLVVSESGIYTIELTNECGRTNGNNSVTVSESVTPPIVTITAAGTTSVCGSGSIDLSVPTQADITYQWLKDGQPVGPNSNRFTATEAGTYGLVLINTCGRVSASNTVTFTITPAPRPETITADGPTTVCGNGRVNLSVPEQVGVTYQWKLNGKNVGDNSNKFTATEAGIYSIELANACGTINGSNSITFTINPTPEPVAITANGPTTFCETGSVTLAVPQQTGINYQWKKDDQNVGTNSHTLTATATGEYTVTLINDCGTVVATNKISVNAQTPLSPPVVTKGERCGPGSITLTATGGTDGEYRWYNAATATAPLTGATRSTFTTPVLQSTSTYYVSLVRNGCESERIPVQGIIHSVSVATISPNVTINYGESTVLKASGGTTYLWQPTTGLSNPTEADLTVRPTETTTYTVTINNPAGCSTEAQVTVTVSQDLVIPTGISPNGDGVNETWEITNINKFPTARIEIFNRWGNKIYDATGYRNNWDGTWKGSPLPVGTYFYVITLEKGRKLTGPISIVH